MDKKHYFYCCLLLLASTSTVLWGCLRDIDHNPEEPIGQQEQFSVAEAKEFFETIAQGITIQGINQSDSSGVKVRTMWESGKLLMSNDVPTVETSLNITPYYSWIDGSYDLLTHGRILINTVMVLVAQKNENGEISFRVAKFIADDDYMKDRPRKFISSPLSVLPVFSGKVIYYDLDGNPLEGTVYESGRHTGDLFPTVGKTGPTLRGDDPDENLNYECFSIQWKDPTRNGGELPEVVVVGKPSPFSSSTCYYNYEGSDGWGGGGGYGGGGGSGGGGGGGSSNSSSPHEPKEAIMVTTSKTTVEVPEQYNINVDIVDVQSNVIGVTFQMSRSTREENWITVYDLTTNAKWERYTYTRTAWTPGFWNIKVIIRFQNGLIKEAIMPYSVEEQFPSKEKFIHNATLRGHLSGELWNMTVDFARDFKNTHTICEHGCFIYLKRDGTYYAGHTIYGQWVQLTVQGVKGDVEFSYNDTPYHPLQDNMDLVVGTMHTHYPLTWAKAGLERNIGASVEDKAASLPGIGYDYKSRVISGHDINAAKDFFIYGPIRRETTK